MIMVPKGVTGGTGGVILEGGQIAASFLGVLCTSRTQRLQKLAAGFLFEKLIEIIHVRFLNIRGSGSQSPTQGTT